ncbi:hypothetical protein [Streptomyces sp. NPDC093970]|uniref:hypothetical protein n=1 Tax=Streptomyces sp. NPDC093970 TaxID=3155076 RepID=UPI00343C0ED1
MYGIKIQRAGGDGDAPLLTVWTRDPDDSAEKLDELKGSITGFLFRDEGLSAQQGYFMDVFGPDGSLQHRLDARLWIPSGDPTGHRSRTDRRASVYGGWYRQARTAAVGA